MNKNITNTIFFFFFFAMGGAPMIAFMFIHAQTSDPAIINNALLGLSVIIACILVPLVLIQNAYLFVKRKDSALDAKIEPLKVIYLGLNIFCLVYWLMVQFL